MTLDDVIKEKTSADHLLYVSLKYTKTCDVILNLLLRWKIMIDEGMDLLVAEMKKKKKWKPGPDAPLAKFVQLRKLYSNTKDVSDALKLYELFREVEKLPKVRESEFRKGVNLKITYKNDIVNVNLEKLAEYAATLERFISYIK